MPWLLKVIVVGALLGGCAFLAAAIPWLPARLGFLTLGCFIFLWSFRDPALTYRRAFHFLVVLPAIPLGLSASAEWFDADGRQGGILKIFVDGSQAFPPWLWLGLAALCVIGDAAVVRKERVGRRELYQQQAVEAEFIDDRRVVRVTFFFRPTHDVKVIGAELRFRGVGIGSKDVRTLIGVGGTGDEATRTNPKTVAANTSVTVTVEATLADKAAERIRKRHKGLLRSFPISAAVRLRADHSIEPLPVKLS